MDARTEEALEELAQENSLRELAHTVTIKFAEEKPYIYDWSGHYCRYCGRHWSSASYGHLRQVLEQHHESCIWRIAKAYAEDVKG